jgi:hypothetical protein
MRNLVRREVPERVTCCIAECVCATSGVPQIAAEFAAKHKLTALGQDRLCALAFGWQMPGSQSARTTHQNLRAEIADRHARFGGAGHACQMPRR